MNYAGSYQVAENLRVGVGGYFLQQLSPHEVNGSEIPDSEEMAFAVGPAILMQRNTFTFRLTAAFDVATENRWDQSPIVNLTITKVWPR